MNRTGTVRFSTWLLVITCLFVLLPPEIDAQDRQVGLMRNAVGTADGYVLFQPLIGDFVYLIDNNGELVHQWQSEYRRGLISYLLENGDLLRAAHIPDHPILQAGGAAGRIERFDWDGNLIWEFELNEDSTKTHHDIEPLPNGNILAIAWEFIPMEEAVAWGFNDLGVDDTGMWPERIVEIAPIGSDSAEIVWEWRFWDHVIQDFDPDKPNYGVVADHPELIDLNFRHSAGDFVHLNAVNYNAELDQIAVSSPEYNEIWIIDHSTTTEEAASHEGGRSGKGGDILYRWGNPHAYDAGTEADQRLFFQHDVRWIPPGYRGEGNLTIFNNGLGRPLGAYSEIFELETPLDGNGGYMLEPGTAFGPEDPVWIYSSTPLEEFSSPIISGAHRTHNGSTFITSGVQGRLFEVTPSGSIVWEYVNPVAVSGPIPINVSPDSLDNRMFRASRYPRNYSAFEGRDLTPIGPIELAPVAAEVELPDGEGGLALVGNYPNPASGKTAIQFKLGSSSRVSIHLYDELGRKVEVLANDEWHTAGLVTTRFDASTVAPGVYFYSIESEFGSVSGRMLVAR